VLEAAAVGVRADEGASAEEEILVCLVPDGDAPDPAALCAWLAERMPYFMVPRYLRVVEHLPKTPTERVRKHHLRTEGVTPDTWDRLAADEVGA
jgi:crotonobetaine/carnitine-CoA ligase